MHGYKFELLQFRCLSMLDLIVRHSIDLYNPCFVWHCWSTVPVLLNTVDAYTAHVFLNIDLTALVLLDTSDIQPMFYVTLLTYSPCFVLHGWPTGHVLFDNVDLVHATLSRDTVDLHSPCFVSHCWPRASTMFSRDTVDLWISVSFGYVPFFQMTGSK